ncbi:MAG: hypothetical protein EOO92_20775, partial [Pedobacter sp.]
MQIQTDQNLNENNESEFNIKEAIFPFLSRWPWFILAVFLALASAYVYLRYTIPVYRASTTILVKDDKKGGMVSELASLSEMDMMGNIKSTVDNEIEVVKSRTIVEFAVRDLELNVRYTTEGTILTQDLYHRSPIKIIYAAKKDFLQSKVYKVDYDGGDTYTLYYPLETKMGTYKFGQIVKSKDGDFTITNQFPTKQDKFSITIIVDPVAKAVQNYKGRLQVELVGEKTSVVTLSINDPVKKRAEDFLNAVTYNYNRDAKEDKEQVFRNTADFIDNRITLISDELGVVERSGETYKKNNQVTDIVSEAGLFLQNATEFEKMFIEVETQLSVVASLRQYVQSASDEDLIPANVLPGSTADMSSAPTLIAEYNALMLRKNQFLKGATLENKRVTQLESQLAALKENVLSNLDRLRATLLIKRGDLAKQQSRLSGKISGVPTQE